MNKRGFNVGICGAGNVSFHLTPILSQKCQSILLYNKTKTHAETIVKRSADNVILLNQPDFTKNGLGIDILIIIVKETAISTIAQQIKITPNTLVIHTAGAVPINTFKTITDNYGCLYPLQTFSKKKKVDTSIIPFFIEGNNDKNTKTIQKLAYLLSPNAHILNGKKRESLHLSAVFACNFVNHCCIISSQILQLENLPSNVLQPLIQETFEKIKELGAENSQTGPAFREDNITMQTHLDLLDQFISSNSQFHSKISTSSIENWKKIYQILSNSIITTKK